MASEYGDGSAANRPVILCVAGFGDDASMFDALVAEPIADTHQILPLDLPGFGLPAMTDGTSLEKLARFVAARAAETGATIIAAHSVASIIASLAARMPGSRITRILSLEGNITAEDAYFSGTAADFDDPQSFRSAFLSRLADMSVGSPIFQRYRGVVAKADPTALWQLGIDARRFSAQSVPGEVLSSAADVTYFYNPVNCPQTTLDWLAVNPMGRVVLKDASHWPSVDAPRMLSERMAEVL